MAAEGWINV